MAELAGMRLRNRWSGWKREPFSNDSREHVSVWEKPDKRWSGPSICSAWGRLHGIRVTMYNLAVRKRGLIDRLIR